MAGSLIEFGLDDSFVTGVRAQLRPGTSALLAVSHATTATAVAAALAPFGPQVLRADLTEDEELRLRATFTEEQAPAA
jgi:uncharacterized membrane protein